MALFNFLRKKEEPKETVVQKEESEDIFVPTKPKNINILDKFTNNPYKFSNRSLNVDARYVFPSMDFETIRLAVEKEPYLKRSINRFVELVWKNGYNLTGKNGKSVKYIERRLKEIAFISNQPTISLLEQITRELITYANVFIKKVRNRKSSTGKSTDLFGKILEPIASYEVLKTSNVAIVSKELNFVDSYVYKIPRFDIEEWLEKNRKNIIFQANYINLNHSEDEIIDKEDMIHIYTEKKLNSYYGNPHILGVIDDCRALRRMEESVETLIFQHTIPLLHVRVGDSNTGSTQDEIDDATFVFENMLTEGLAVSDYRYKVDVINASQASIDVIPYLEYFKLRILTGMGQSLISIGESGQSSRATAEVLNEAVIDMAKRYQRTVGEFVNNKIIFELLIEGGFDPFNSDECVKMTFKEISDTLKHKEDFQAMQLYQGGVITLNEARERMGYMPLPNSEKVNLFNGEQSPQAAQAASQTAGNRNQHSDEIDKLGFLNEALDFYKNDLVNIKNYKNKEAQDCLAILCESYNIKGETKEKIVSVLSKILTNINTSKDLNVNNQTLFMSEIRYILDTI